MLVLKAYVNYDQIDEVWIQNTGEHVGDIYEYRIKRPKGYEHKRIMHSRPDGWGILGEKTLNILNNERVLI